MDCVSQQMTNPLYLEPQSKIPVHIGLEEQYNDEGHDQRDLDDHVLEEDVE